MVVVPREVLVKVRRGGYVPGIGPVRGTTKSPELLVALIKCPFTD
jgi:hypothetical protein